MQRSHQYSGRIELGREEQDKQQLKTFTRWWNSWLETSTRVPPPPLVTDLCKEIKPGLISFDLIELLSASDAAEIAEYCKRTGSYLPRLDEHGVVKYNKSLSGPAAPYQMLENHEIFLALLKSKNVPLDYESTGPANLVDGNRTLILGLTWTLIQHYEGVKSDELLDWVKQVTNNYDGVNVTHWHTSFNDGLALCAVLNKHSSQVTPLPPAPTPTPHPPPPEAAIRPRPRPARKLALPTHPTRPHPSARTAPTITPSTTLYSPSYLPHLPHSRYTYRA